MQVLALVQPETKPCARCKQTLSVAAFGKDNNRISGLYPYCRKCKSLENKKFVRKCTRTKHANNLSKYGITPEQYHQMHVLQNGACAICLRPERSKLHDTAKRLAVDHCHTTGRVRGLLCTACNTSIGKLQDNPEIIERAAAYVRCR